MKLLKPVYRKFRIQISFLFVVGVLFLMGPSQFGKIGPVGDAFNNLLDFVPLRAKFGEAFVDAAILALIVDPYLKNKLLEEVSKDALIFAAGYVLPDQLKKLLNRIIKVPYTREKFQIALSLSPIPNNPGFVRLMIHTSYDLVNRIDMPVLCRIRTAIERGGWTNIGRSELLAYEITGLQLPIRLGEADLQHLQIDDNIHLFSMNRKSDCRQVGKVSCISRRRDQLFIRRAGSMFWISMK